MPIFCKFYRLFDRFNGTPDRKETYTYEGDSTNVAKVAYDDNADGKTDRVALNTYDANGNLVNTEYHNDGVESNPENRVETNSYDANGNLVQKAIDANGDGQVDTIETYTVNDKGQRTGTSYADANGNVYKSETYVLDNNGNWLEKHVNEDGKANTGDSNGVDRIEKYELNAKGEAIKVSYDNNADGNTDAVEYRVLDANGNTLVKYVNADNGTTGNTTKLSDGRTVTGIDKIETNTLNAKGQVVETLYDNNADGKADSRTEFVRNVNGNVVEEKRDVTNDGTIDKVSQYTIDAQGRWLARTDYNQLADGSLVQTQREEYTLNENGNWIGMTRYTGESTTPSVVETYEVNALGQRTKALIDNYGDKVIDRAEIYTLDANGRTTKTETDVGNDDSIDSNTTYERNALGQTTKELIDSNNDGTPEIIRTYQYDAQGKQTYRGDDTNADGTPDSAYYYTYNAQGLADTMVYDRTGNGITDDDMRRSFQYDEQGREIITIEKGNLNAAPVTNYREYNDDGLVSKRSVDQDGSGKIDSARDTVIEYEYDAIWKAAIKEVRTNGLGEAQFTLDMDRNDSGIIVRTFRDTGSTGSVNTLHYGYGDNNWTVDFTDDITQWNSTQLAKIEGLQNIQLSVSNYKTEITLDSATIGKIAPTGTVAGKASSLTINGDATDTVNLEGNGFTKLDTTQKIGSNTFDMYTTTVNDTTYTLFIDNDVNTVLG